MRLIAEFEIPGLPKTVNQNGYKHWAVKLREATRWKKLIIEQCVLARIRGLKLPQATLEFTRFSSQACDFDNLAGSFKHCLDGLTEAEVIMDDKPSVIGSPTFIWQKVKQKEGRIRVKIWAHSGSADKA